MKEKLNVIEVGYNYKMLISYQKKITSRTNDIFIKSKAVIALDTGLAHLAAACNVFLI